MKKYNFIILLFLLMILSCKNYKTIIINDVANNWNKYIDITIKTNEIRKGTQVVPSYSIILHKNIGVTIDSVKLHINYDHCEFYYDKTIIFNESNELFNKFNKGENVILKYSFKKIKDCSNEQQYEGSRN